MELNGYYPAMADDELEREFEAIVAEARLLAASRGDPDLNQGHIFSAIIARVIEQAPADATKEQITARAKELIRRYGFDPDRPWLARGQTDDDL